MHARIDGGKVALLTRTGLDWSHRYRRTIEALQSLPVKSAYLDGELCALNSDGVPVFSRLQAAMDEGRTDQLVFYAFDLLFLNGESTAQQPLVKRKDRLQRLFRKEIHGLRYSEHVVTDGPRFREHACRLGLEGVISKRIDRPYAPGDREIWLKSKCLNREEFVVVGWTDPEGSRSHIGALLLDYYTDDGRVLYAGRAGTGITDKELKRLAGVLAPLHMTKMPLAAPPPRDSRFGSPLIAQMPEDTRFDKKSSRVSVDTLATLLSAFGNGPAVEGGVVAIGIADNGEIEGCKFLSESRRSDIERCGRDRCHDGRFQTRRVACHNANGEDDFVILGRVHYVENRLVECTDGTAYCREGDTTRRLTEAEKQEFRINKGERAFELEPCPLTYPDDFRINEVTRFAAQIRASRGGSDAISDHEILQSMRMGSVKAGAFIPNNVCALLFAKYPQLVFPGAYVHVLRYNGVEEKTGSEYNVIKDRIIGGTIMEVIKEAATFVDSNLREFTEFRSGKFYHYRTCQSSTGSTPTRHKLCAEGLVALHSGYDSLSGSGYARRSLLRAS
jgi:bifunctional non-homologous end joining protein LigD